MQSIQDKLIFITHQTEKYDYLSSARVALDGGCAHVQLRMKGHLPEQVEETAWKIKELCDTYCADLYINDHVQVCKKIAARGVHLGKSDMPIEQAREMLGENFVIGGTANTFEDIFRLYKAGVNYIGLGPFRFTQTKENLSSLLGLDGYKILMKKCKESDIHIPIYAIGGITKEDIPAIMKTGVSGIAMSSAILEAGNPIQETKEIIDQIKIYRQ